MTETAKSPDYFEYPLYLMDPNAEVDPSQWYHVLPKLLREGIKKPRYIDNDLYPAEPFVLDDKSKDLAKDGTLSLRNDRRWNRANPIVGPISQLPQELLGRIFLTIFYGSEEDFEALFPVRAAGTTFTHYNGLLEKAPAVPGNVRITAKCEDHKLAPWIKPGARAISSMDQATRYL